MPRRSSPFRWWPENGCSGSRRWRAAIRSWIDERDEANLSIVGNQIAMGMDGCRARRQRQGRRRPVRRRAGYGNLVYYRNGDCAYVDGEYLIRNAPGKFLWKVSTPHRREGRSEIAEPRAFASTPPWAYPRSRTSLESRPILLRRRLAGKCQRIRLVPVRRGRLTRSPVGSSSKNARAPKPGGSAPPAVSSTPP